MDNEHMNDEGVSVDEIINQYFSANELTEMRSKCQETEITFNYEYLLINRMELGAYICHTLSKKLIEKYITSPNSLQWDLFDLRVSHRGGKYYVIKGFEVFEALKCLEVESIQVRVDEFETMEAEEELYRFLNAKSINDSVSRLKIELSRITEEYSFMDAVSKVAIFERENFQHFFELLWEDIPDDYLYETYKNVLNDATSGFYANLFTSDLLQKLHKLNKHDTVNSPKLQRMLGKDGYLTIYHGHVKKTLRNSNSWTTEPEIAHFFGCRNVYRQAVDNYYIVTAETPHA